MKEILQAPLHPVLFVESEHKYRSLYVIILANEALYGQIFQGTKPINISNM